MHWTNECERVCVREGVWLCAECEEGCSCHIVGVVGLVGLVGILIKLLSHYLAADRQICY